MRKTAVIVVGAGASGLMAAASAARTLTQRKAPGGVLVLEAGKKPGRKLLATGNGRCNLSNREIAAAHYHGDTSAAFSLLQTYPAGEARRTFEQMGLATLEDGAGRIYPRGEQAAAVLQTLLTQCRRWGAEILCEQKAECLHQENGQWVVSAQEEAFAAPCVIVASGSPAAPQLGGSDSGRALLAPFHLTAAPFFPGLCPVRAAGQRLSALKGMRSKGTVRLLADGGEVARESGEIQFTGEGLSGICVFQLSRWVSEWESSGTVRGKKRKNLAFSLDLLPEMTEEEVFAHLLQRCRLLPQEPAADLLSGLLNLRVGQEICRSALDGSGKEPKKNAACRKEELWLTAKTAKDWRFVIKGTGGWEQAQVACGGVKMENAAPHSLEIAGRPGLFLAGELWNVDGDCGGFNLHWAFLSGKTAGMAAARRAAGLLLPKKKEGRKT